MSDLLARRHHGAVRLGLSPILLAGLPGTGKTRFAQRLSDLLGTPNTVINLAGMSDVKVLKGVARGWSSNRPSRMLEFIQQTRIANPLFVLDEIDKTGAGYSNGGDPQEALLDLLEPGNAKRYQDIYLMAECDLSHCLYVATSNSLARVPEPLLSRLRPVYFPPPGPEHTESIVRGMLADLARSWGLPEGTLTVTPHQIALLRGLAPRELRRALLDLFGGEANGAVYTLH
ncbi:AAA family ATPase [Castellaniella sp. FW104-7G2B]